MISSDLSPAYRLAVLPESFTVLISPSSKFPTYRASAMKRQDFIVQGVYNETPDLLVVLKIG
jgi:hypothetical protein